MFKKMALTTVAAFFCFFGHAATIRTVESFYNTSILMSSGEDISGAIAFTDLGAPYGISYSQYTPNGVYFEKTQLAGGAVSYAVSYYKSLAFTYSSNVVFKYNDRFIPLGRTPFTSVSSLRAPADSVVSLIANYKKGDQVQILFGGLSVVVTEPTINEWRQLINASPSDASLGGIGPIGGEPVVMGGYLHGWAYDPKAPSYQPMLHIYRGSKIVGSVVANQGSCLVKDNVRCAELPVDALSKWKKYVYSFDLSGIREPSLESIKIYALNSVAGQQNSLIFEGSMIFKDDVDCVYDWAQKILPEILGGKYSSTIEGNARVRRYSTGSMLATTLGSGEWSFIVEGGPHTPGGKLIDLLPAALEGNCGR